MDFIITGHVVAMFAISMIGLGISASEHGKPKKGNHNFWISLISSIISWWLIVAALTGQHPQ